jgi:hypothetical protein
MAMRMIAAVADETARRDIDLVRALYDRTGVEKTPPHVPIVDPFEENTPLTDLIDMVGLIVGAHQPFMLELGTPERIYDHDPDTDVPQLLQLTAAQGAEESQRLAEALYRDVFPHQRPDSPTHSALQRTAMTIGRFRLERDADRAVVDLAGKSYFLVVTQVAILEADEGAWPVQHVMDLGGMIHL